MRINKITKTKTEIKTEDFFKIILTKKEAVFLAYLLNYIKGDWYYNDTSEKLLKELNKKLNSK